MSNPLDSVLVEKLYRRYWFQVQRRCRRILLSDDLAKEAAQEVFVRLITHGGDFRHDAEWMTWLYQIATNICLNWVRNRSRRNEAWLSEYARTSGSFTCEPERILVHQDFLRQVLKRFDQKTQEMAIYYYLDEMDQEEIGKVMNLSRVSVNKRLRKLRLELDGFLKED